jgi:hypothetical protein
MITLPLKTYYSATGEYPIDYVWTASDPCVTFDVDNGTTLDGLIDLVITAESESCLATTTITLTTSDANGCPSNQTFTLPSLCDNFTLGTISQTGAYTFTASASSPLCTSMSYQWNFDQTLFNMVTAIGNQSGTTVELQPIDGVVFPSQTNISLIATDCNGCEKITTYPFTICKATPQNFTYQLYCNDEETQYVGNTFYMPEPTGCDYDWDWDTVQYGPTPPGITIIPGTAGRFFEVTGDITMSPGAYSLEYSLSSTTGIQTYQGTISVIVNPCSPGTTISLPALTYTIDCDVIIGDVVQIPITFAVNDPSVVIDWSTFQVLNPPTPASSSITHLTLPNGDHVIEYEVPAITGTDVFVWTVCDTLGNCATAVAFTIILDCGGSPNTQPDSACVECGSTVNIPVLDNDLTDGIPFLINTVQVVTPPTNGIATPLGDGTIQYTPNNPAGTDEDTFTYTVTNVNGYSDLTPALVTVEIYCAGEDSITTVCNT